MIPVLALETQHLMLRPFGPEDYDYIMDLHDMAARTTYDDVDNFPDREAYLDHVRQVLSTNAAGWVIRSKPLDIALGLFYFMDIISGITATVHPVLDRRAVKDLMPKDSDGRKVRIMAEVATVALPYVVESFDLLRVGGAFAEHNVPAIALCEKLGFKREGYIRNGVRIKNEPRAMIILGMTRDEIFSRYKKEEVAHEVFA